MSLSPASAPSLEAIRAQFPALDSGFVFLENAGGSQVPRSVIESTSRFFDESYVQTGVEYPASERATQVVVDAHAFLNRMFNGEGLGHVAIGSSTTSLLYLLGNCFADRLVEGDEVVVSVTNHESHVGPWVRLAKRGVTVKWWGVDPETGLSSLDELAELVNERTKIVAFTHTCNLSGDLVDPKAVAAIAHRVGAKAVVDCVAAAPHQALDVKDWGVDFCAFSAYKVYGPHFAALWGRSEAWMELEGPNHFFLPNVETKRFEIGCLPYELLAGYLALQGYFCFLAGTDGECSREVIETAYGVIEGLERGLEDRFMGFLESKPKVRYFGPRRGDLRHPTFGFVHVSMPSDQVVAKVLANDIGIRYGHMYAYRMTEAIQVSPEPGVVRVSALHYNTPEEIDRICGVLDEIL